MEKPYLKAFGSGFAVFGFGLNVVLRVAPMIGWQPSYVAAVTLLALGFVCMAGGALMFVITVIPSDTTVYAVFSRYWKPVVVWFFALLAFAFISWQSITIYKLRDVSTRVPVARHLTDAQQRAITAAMLAAPRDPNFVLHIVVIPGHGEADSYAGDFAQILQKVQIRPGALIMRPPNQIAMTSPDGSVSSTGQHMTLSDEAWLDYIGLTMFVRDLTHKPRMAIVFVDALTAQGIKVNWQLDDLTLWYVAPVMGLQFTATPHLLSPDECYLLVGLRQPE